MTCTQTIDRYFPVPEMWNKIYDSFFSKKRGNMITDPANIRYQSPKALSINSSETIDAKMKIELLDKVLSYTRLERNWDGNGSEPITSEIIKPSLELLFRVPSIPIISPTSNNSILFCYSNTDKSLEIEVERDNLALLEYQNDEFVREDEQLSMDTLLKEVISFYGS